MSNEHHSWGNKTVTTIGFPDADERHFPLGGHGEDMIIVFASHDKSEALLKADKERASRAGGFLAKRFCRT